MPGPTHICGLTLNSDRSIREELRPLMHLLAPHIARAHERAWKAKPPPTPNAATLARRESEVLHWLAQGKRDAEIAIILGISRRTVSKHVEHILAKLGVETRGAAVAGASQR